METQTYIKQPVEAVQFTQNNYKEVAEWCGGKLHEFNYPDTDLGPYAKGIELQYPEHFSFLGDYICKENNRFYVVQQEEFEKAYRQKED